MGKISSKIIGEKDVIIPKPTYLKTLINFKDPEKTFFKIIGFNFNLENFMLSNINEFFIGDKTLFSVKIPVSISLEEELFNFFWSFFVQIVEKFTFTKRQLFIKWTYCNKTIYFLTS